MQRTTHHKALLSPPSAWLMMLAAMLFSTGLITCLSLLYATLPYHGMSLERIDTLLSFFILLNLFYGLIGGCIAHYIGPRNTLISGGLLCVIGMVLLSAHPIIYAGMGCFVVGTGLLKPNLFNAISLLTPRFGQLRYRAFIIIFFADNLGIIVGNIIATHFPNVTNIGSSFLITALLSMIAIFVFIFATFLYIPSHRLDRKAKPDIGTFSIAGIYLFIVAMTLVTTEVFHYANNLLAIFLALTIITISIFIGAYQYRHIISNKYRLRYRQQCYSQLFCMFYWLLYTFTIVNIYWLFPEPVTSNLMGDMLFPHISASAFGVLLIGPALVLCFQIARSSHQFYPQKRLLLGTLSMCISCMLIWHVLSPAVQDHTLPQWLGEGISGLLLAICGYWVVPTQLALVGHMLSRRHETIMMGITQVVIGTSWLIAKLLMIYISLPSSITANVGLHFLNDSTVVIAVIVALVFWQKVRYAH